MLFTFYLKLECVFYFHIKGILLYFEPCNNEPKYATLFEKSDWSISISRSES